MKTYINSISSVNALPNREGIKYAFPQINPESGSFTLNEPAYEETIKVNELRRMPRLVKMGMHTSAKCLRESSTEAVDAIIVGTGLGSFDGFERFEQSIIQGDEDALSPTPFIQSLDNTMAGHLSLKLQCNGYNMTYVHRGFSFESALMDAKMHLEENDGTNKILVGGLDETPSNYIKLIREAGHACSASASGSSIAPSEKKGSIPGEGSTFMLLSSSKHQNTIAEVRDVRTLFKPQDVNMLEEEIFDLVSANGLSTLDLDLVLFGHSGDPCEDEKLNRVEAALFEKHHKVYFKEFCGEFQTASAFAVWLTVNYMEQPARFETAKRPKEIKNALVINQYRGVNYSFILLSNVESEINAPF